MAKIDPPDYDDLISELKKGLKIDEHALDESLVRQADLFFRVSREVAILTSRRDAMKQELATTEAQADLDIRKGAAKNEDKFTEGEVKARIRLHKDVKEVQNELLELNSWLAQFTALKEAYSQRSYVLKDLVALFIANYYGSGAEGRSSRDLRARAAERTRDHYRNRS